MPRDAEAWLAERGITREPLRIAAPPDAADADAPDTAAMAPSPEQAPPIGVTEAADLADQARREPPFPAGGRDRPPAGEGRLEDDVASAMAFVRRSVAGAPQAEGRIRTKLAERSCPRPVIDAVLERARRERLVDDPAMAAALVEERRAKGHAAARIRRDLRERGFDEQTLDAALAEAEAEDPAALAFAVARDKAAGLTALPTEKAFRRVAAHVARRGYGEALARKVARDAVFATREDQRTAGH